jgi:predicted small secreted protein
MFVKILIIVIVALTALLLAAGIFTRGPRKKYDAVN